MRSSICAQASSVRTRMRRPTGSAPPNSSLTTVGPITARAPIGWSSGPYDTATTELVARAAVAVSAPNGLVVPVVRNVDQMGFADIEKAIGDLGKRAKDGSLTMADMAGGTFTISNGGVFGGLMSTPIINPPQSAVLGLHRIEDRPVVRDGQIVIRPMMYLALSYDHRLIDGREAVTALKTIKEAIEDPTRLLIDM